MSVESTYWLLNIEDNVCSVVLNIQPLSFYIKSKYDHLISMILYFSMKLMVNVHA